MKQDIKGILGIKDDGSKSWIDGGIAVMHEFHLSYEELINLPMPAYFVLQDKVLEIYEARNKK